MVARVDAALSKRLEILAVFDAAPLASTRSWHRSVFAILGLARDVVEERRGLVVAWRRARDRDVVGVGVGRAAVGCGAAGSRGSVV